MIERLDLGLIEFGPAPFAINVGADLVAIRSLVEDHLAVLSDLTPEERAELARRLTLDSPPDDPAPAPVVEATDEVDPQPDPSTPEPVDPGSSVELLEIEAELARLRD